MVEVVGIAMIRYRIIWGLQGIGDLSSFIWVDIFLHTLIPFRILLFDMAVCKISTFHSLSSIPSTAWVADTIESWYITMYVLCPLKTKVLCKRRDRCLVIFLEA